MQLCQDSVMTLIFDIKIVYCTWSRGLSNSWKWCTMFENRPKKSHFFFAKSKQSELHLFEFSWPKITDFRGHLRPQREQRPFNNWGHLKPLRVQRPLRSIEVIWGQWSHLRPFEANEAIWGQLGYLRPNKAVKGYLRPLKAREANCNAIWRENETFFGHFQTLW